MARRLPGLAWAVAAGIAAALPAAAADEGGSTRTSPEEALREELRRTREEMKALQDRVKDLESRLPGGAAPAPSEISKAVGEYMASHPPASANVSAPGLRSLRFTGEVRIRAERWDRAYRPNDPLGKDVQDQALLRTTLGADAAVSESVRARVAIRDARAFGQEPSTTTELQAATGGIDLKEGWVEADDLLGTGATVRVGRQVLKYGDERLIGDNDWGAYGRSFDGLLATKIVRKWKVDAFYTRVFEGGLGAVGAGVENDDADFFGVYASKARVIHGHSDLDLYLLGTRSGFEAAGEGGAPGTTLFGTAGARVAGGKGAFDWGLEVAAQRGRLNGRPLSAYAAHARLGHTWKDAAWKPRLGIEWNQATGDRDPGSESVQTFQPLFPTNHSHYGEMDVAGWENSRGWRLSLTLKPGDRWTVQADLHRFYMEEAADAWYAPGGAVIRSGTAGGSHYLGTEANVTVRYRADDHVVLDFGAGQFFDGPFVGDTGPSGDAFWIFVQVTVSF